MTFDGRQAERAQFSRRTLRPCRPTLDAVCRSACREIVDGTAIQQARPICTTGAMSPARSALPVGRARLASLANRRHRWQASSLRHLHETTIITSESWNRNSHSRVNANKKTCGSSNPSLAMAAIRAAGGQQAKVRLRCRRGTPRPRFIASDQQRFVRQALGGADVVGCSTLPAAIIADQPIASCDF